MKTKSIALSFVASALFAGIGIAPAIAQHTNTPGIDRAQDNIHARIQQGIASGHITQQEAQVLYQREREIQMREMRIKRDGSATPQERQQLRQDLEDMRAEVERKMSNPRVAGGQGTNTPGIDNRADQIHARIEQGIDSGHITRGEARRLFQREREIERRERRFKSDGVVTRDERRQLRDQLTLLQDDVERMMANDRVRGDNYRR
ncbi:MAG: hypothetical protein V4632_05125 [Pseudomonadota bacterium]